MEESKISTIKLVKSKDKYGCGHVFSSHKITVNTKTSKLDGKCKVCGSKSISEG